MLIIKVVMIMWQLVVMGHCLSSGYANVHRNQVVPLQVVSDVFIGDRLVNVLVVHIMFTLRPGN